MIGAYRLEIAWGQGPAYVATIGGALPLATCLRWTVPSAVIGGFNWTQPAHRHHVSKGRRFESEYLTMNSVRCEFERMVLKGIDESYRRRVFLVRNWFLNLRLG